MCFQIFSSSLYSKNFYIHTFFKYLLPKITGISQLVFVVKLKHQIDIENSFIAIQLNYEIKTRHTTFDLLG